jgi:UDPglucose 6-dehydrogenase
LLVESLEVGVVGAGYVGLATGACLAYLGHRVACLDRDEGRVESLEKGKVPFYEPGLEGMVARGIRDGRLTFAGLMGLDSVVSGADVVFVAVGTPQGMMGRRTSRTWLTWRAGSGARSPAKLLRRVGGRWSWGR